MAASASRVAAGGRSAAGHGAPMDVEPHRLRQHRRAGDVDEGVGCGERRAERVQSCGGEEDRSHAEVGAQQATDRGGALDDEELVSLDPASDAGSRRSR